MYKLDKVIARISHCLSNESCIECLFNKVYLPDEYDYCNSCNVILREALDVLFEVKNNGMANN